MKLIRIIMSAFGSYADKETIEFDRRADGLFLIAGDTGSGKTTVFDAVMYALYDKTSGGNRSGNMMRSQFAQPDVPTFVQLDFEYDGRKYSVKRNPEYKRESRRKNADGTAKVTTERASVSLTLPDGSEFAGNKSETDSRLSEIIGLNADQFAQVAMIAQGDFMRLLYADSKTRREIFSKIFKTGDYRNLQLKLKEESNLIRQDLAENARLYSEELKNIRVDIGKDDTVNVLEELKRGREPDCDRAVKFLEHIVTEQSGRLEKLENLRKEIRAQSEEVNAAEHKLIEAERAYRASQKRKEELLDQLKAAKRGIEQKQEERLRINAEYEGRALKLKADISRTEENLPRYVQLRDISAKAASAKKDVDEARNRLQNVTEAEEGQKNIRFALEKYQEENKNCRLEYQKAEVEAARAAELLNRTRELADRAKLIEKKKEEAEKLADLYSIRVEEYNKANAEYERLESIFMSEQAGILAKNLEEGKPCPVCGSIYHPMPCAMSEENVTQEEVKSAREARKQADITRQKAMEAGLAAGKEYKTEREALERDIRDYVTPGSDVFAQEKRLCTEVVKIEKEKSRLENIVSVYDDNEKSLKSCNEEIERLGRDRESAESASEQAAKEYAKLEGMLGMLKEGLEFDDEAEAKIYLDGLKKELDELEQERGGCEQEIQKLQNELAVKRGEADNESVRNENLLTEYDKIKKEFASILIKDGFDPEQAGVKDELEEREREADEARVELHGMLNRNMEAKKVIAKLGKKRAADLQKYKVYGTLYETACGDIKGSARMDFETYVLRRYFGEIISAANHRLARMNDGQWRLKCRNIEDLANRGKTGLELDVHDEVAGLSRDVKTLSGGETFMAALAMALGMADIIQSQAGAVRMETMFIDEGFGSLDDHSRQQAVGILCELADGKRSIGIISHVTELKEQIDRQLIVRKTNRGSHACWKE